MLQYNIKIFYFCLYCLQQVPGEALLLLSHNSPRNKNFHKGKEAALVAVLVIDSFLYFWMMTLNPAQQ
jgi:hypothetical protein